MLYYEAHTTIDPVFGPTRQKVIAATAPHGFRMAALYMRKTSETETTAHVGDSFLAARSRSLPGIGHTGIMTQTQKRRASPQPPHAPCGGVR